MPTSQDLGSVRQAQDIIHTIRDQHASNKPKEKWNKIEILFLITLSIFNIISLMQVLVYQEGLLPEQC